MAATPSSDQTCRDCEAGVRFSASVDSACQPVSPPCEESGEQETRAATTSADRLCAPTTSTTATTTTTTTATATVTTPNAAAVGASKAAQDTAARGPTSTGAAAAAFSKAKAVLQEAQESLAVAEVRAAKSDAAAKACLAGRAEDDAGGTEVCAALQSAADEDAAAVSMAMDAVVAKSTALAAATQLNKEAKKAASEAADGGSGSGVGDSTVAAAWTRGSSNANTDTLGPNGRLLEPSAAHTPAARMGTCRTGSVSVLPASCAPTVVGPLCPLPPCP